MLEDETVGGAIMLQVERKGRHKGRITLTPDMMEHLGIRGGDRVRFTPMPDGSVILEADDKELRGDAGRAG